MRTACAPVLSEEPASPASPVPSEAASDAASEAATAAPAEQAAPQVTTIATDLAAPWDVAFTPDGAAWITERDSGRLLRLEAGGTPKAVQTIAVDDTGEGGLLGVAASPDFASDGLLYLYRSTTSGNQLLRVQPGDDPDVLIDDIPHGAIHNAGRIAFGPDDMLYVGTGDAGDETTAQDLDSLAGKILRVAPDGSVPADNPDPTSYVYAHGLRDPQGLTWDADRTLYASEFGPDRDDEVNSLLVAALRGQRLWRVPTGDPAGAEPLYVGEFGRLRHAAQAPDGSIWLLTSNRDGRGQPADDDRVLRIAPAG